MSWPLHFNFFDCCNLAYQFFSGLRSNGKVICVITGDGVFSTLSNLMDIRVISTMGLTDDDVEALSQIEGISGAEPGYMKDVITKQNETRLRS